jgi:hypothetical protein
VAVNTFSHYWKNSIFLFLGNKKLREKVINCISFGLTLCSLLRHFISDKRYGLAWMEGYKLTVNRSISYFIYIRNKLQSTIAAVYMILNGIMFNQKYFKFRIFIKYKNLQRRAYQWSPYFFRKGIAKLLYSRNYFKGRINII